MEEGGCPFSHFDKDNLMKVLECTGSGENYKEIIELAADGCYNLACSKFLNKRVEVWMVSLIPVWPFSFRGLIIVFVTRFIPFSPLIVRWRF